MFLPANVHTTLQLQVSVCNRSGRFAALHGMTRSQKIFSRQGLFNIKLEFGRFNFDLG